MNKSFPKVTVYCGQWSIANKYLPISAKRELNNIGFVVTYYRKKSTGKVLLLRCEEKKKKREKKEKVAYSLVSNEV